MSNVYVSVSDRIFIKLVFFIQFHLCLLLLTSLPLIHVIGHKHCPTGDHITIADPTHPHHGLFFLLASGKRFHSIWSSAYSTIMFGVSSVTAVGLIMKFSSMYKPSPYLPVYRKSIIRIRDMKYACDVQYDFRM